MHRVRYGDVISEFEAITCGVPQGTKLGPVVFLAIVNSLCRTNQLRVKFVDDLAFGDIIDIKDKIEYPTQEHLDTLKEECIKVLVLPNPLKCEVMYSIPT